MAWSYVARRVAQLVPALAAILVITFTLVHVAPGDPVGTFAGEYADEEMRAAIREQWGLDRPMWSQLLTYAGRLVRGDLGDSYVYGRPVTTIIGERLPATVLLAGTALVMSLVWGLLLGLVAARRPSGVLDTTVTTSSLLVNAVPSFFLAQLAILLIGLRWGVPFVGMTDSRVDYRGFEHVVDVGRHLALPAVVLALSEVTLVARLTRTGLVNEMAAPYTRTAEAKGLAADVVLSRHALRNASLPLITVVGARVGFLFSGAVIIETVFSWPGVGGLLVDAANSGDRPMTLGLVLMVATSVLITNLVTDLVYAWVDPRIRHR
jgi:peptide/nickel transport system permease protein